jgi:hypothetical protein
MKKLIFSLVIIFSFFSCSTYLEGKFVVIEKHIQKEKSMVSGENDTENYFLNVLSPAGDTLKNVVSDEHTYFITKIGDAVCVVSNGPGYDRLVADCPE